MSVPSAGSGGRPASHCTSRGRTGTPSQSASHAITRRSLQRALRPGLPPPGLSQALHVARATPACAAAARWLHSLRRRSPRIHWTASSKERLGPHGICIVSDTLQQGTIPFTVRRRCAGSGTRLRLFPSRPAPPRARLPCGRARGAAAPAVGARAPAGPGRSWGPRGRAPRPVRRRG